MNSTPNHFDRPTFPELKFRFNLALSAIFKKKSALRQQFSAYLIPKPNEKLVPLAEKLAIDYCAAREILSRTHNPQQNPLRTPIEINLAVFRILLDQDPLYRELPSEFRASWNEFKPLFAAIRDRDVHNDPGVKREMAAQRKEAREEKRSARLRELEAGRKRPSGPKRARLVQRRFGA